MRLLGRTPADPFEHAEPRRPCPLRARHDDPVVLFIQRRREARDVQSPDLIGPLDESKLSERDPQLCRPALSVDRGPRFPDRIETRFGTLFVVAWMITIETNARGADAECVRGTAIVVGVERDEEVLRLGAHVVATAERRLNRRWIAAVHACADIQGVFVVHKLHFHAFGRRRALDRFFLVKSDTATACSQARSSRRPSTRIAPSATRTIVARFGSVPSRLCACGCRRGDTQDQGREGGSPQTSSGE